MANGSEDVGFPESGEVDNSSYTEGPYVPYHLRPETYIVPVLFGIIFIVGVVGNGSLIMIFCRHKAMRSVPNTFIFNLALGDLLVLLVSVPFTSTIFTLESWPYGTFLCKFTEFAKDTSVGVSVFTLIALSADRYLAIVDPLRTMVSGPKSKRMLFSLALIWALAIALGTPGALFSHVKKVEITNSANRSTFIQVCYPFPSDFGPYYPKMIVLMKALAHYIIPLLIIGTFYSIMGHHLLRSANALPGQATPFQSGHSSSTVDIQPQQGRARRKVVKMVLSFVVLFAVCFFPNHVFFMWFHFHPNSQESYNQYWHSFRIIGFCLAFINSCINPIALYFVSGCFRNHFNRILCCCRANRSRLVEHSCVSQSSRPIHYPRLHNRSRFEPSNTSPTETNREHLPLHSLRMPEGTSQL